ncbi:NAD(P)/FAD-dependent oxidoreductase [Actinoplanes sp. KI2]|uniref:NAD(P)/FAD-dependent oxidoreductase n=1 Tax=Actinoplanes sp. KI2 TaxID=2983315 RepID=UPI0021D5C55E|nr:NAD(P)/FAD-dependent oxidoreductase [Actinoplanes sp. KI2]MCU7729224.1 NAD(P)/FAD-dependent oxidoreductase [Actinoplanes sp. KI2]
MTDAYEVIVIGGGAAGLSGALMLARSRRRVLVIDAGQPRNAPADGVHGLLGREGMSPLDLVAHGREEVRGYGGEIVDGEVASAVRDGDGFAVEMAGGRRIRAGRLLVTTGLVDELPEVPGLREGWGHDVVHCPYCHGWEIRDRAVGVLATGPMSVHQALLFRQLSDDVLFFLHRQPDLSDEQAEQLAARGITVVPGEVDRVAEGGVHLRSGQFFPRQAIAVATRMVARGGFLSGLGLKPINHPSGMGEHVPADATGRTEVPGVWAAGNVTDLSAQVSAAAAQGALAGAQINFDLVAEETAAAAAGRG